MPGTTRKLQGRVGFGGTVRESFAITVPEKAGRPVLREELLQKVTTGFLSQKRNIFSCTELSLFELKSSRGPVCLLGGPLSNLKGTRPCPSPFKVGYKR